MKQDLINALESIVDKSSMSDVINALSMIASEKADHIRINWQDEALARVWERMGRTLDRCYNHVNRVDRLLP